MSLGVETSLEDRLEGLKGGSGDETSMLYENICERIVRTIFKCTQILYYSYD